MLKRIGTCSPSMAAVDMPAPVSQYYDAIDADEYAALASVLQPAFVHVRPDRTIRGRDAFVQFMRESRPRNDTEHRIDASYRGNDGSVAIQGTLATETGESLFAFVDLIELTESQLRSVWTYTR